MPLAKVKVPAGQLNPHEPEPTLEYWPDEHSVQLLRILAVLWYCPAGQSTHRTLLAYDPAEHIELHIVAPAPEYWPKVQGMHALMNPVVI